jgi:hypothetical protein
MRREVARYIAATVMRYSNHLGDILPFAKTHCSDAEYRKLAFSLASAIHSIDTEIVEKVLADHPDLKKEFEDSIQNFGVII